MENCFIRGGRTAKIFEINEHFFAHATIKFPIGGGDEFKMFHTDDFFFALTSENSIKNLNFSNFIKIVSGEEEEEEWGGGGSWIHH